MRMGFLGDAAQVKGRGAPLAVGVAESRYLVAHPASLHSP
jgi:hypothetical protein